MNRKRENEELPYTFRGEKSFNFSNFFSLYRSLPLPRPISSSAGRARDASQTGIWNVPDVPSQCLSLQVGSNFGKVARYPWTSCSGGVDLTLVGSCQYQFRRSVFSVMMICDAFSHLSLACGGCLGHPALGFDVLGWSPAG